MANFYKTIVPNYEFWIIPPPSRNFIIVLTAPCKLKDFEKYDASDISEYTSESLGSRYYLYWNEKQGIDRSKSLQKLIKTRLKKFC